MSNHERIRAFVDGESIVWPEAEGITFWLGEPTVGGKNRPVHVSVLLWDLYDGQPEEGHEIAYVAGCHRSLTEAEAQVGLTYGREHAALFEGHAAREWLDEGKLGEEPEQRATFLADLRALLADVDAAKAREFALLARIALLRNHLVDQRQQCYLAQSPGITQGRAAELAVKWLRTQGLEEAPQ